MRVLPVIFSIFLLSFSSASFGQYYDTGRDPGSLKWMQIKTGRFKVIYPKSYGSGGADFARSLEDAYSKITTLYPEKKFRIPVVIHSYTTNSNGYVAWAPSRMEIYPTPEQNTIPLDANRQLALHELTHVFQMESLNKGFTKALSLVAGQQVIGVVSSLLPLWFLEGDAVFSESVLSGSGRGRSPSFQKELKALTLERGSMFKYDKIVNGSFRDFVPDYYETGFQMMAWSYSKYGPDIWRKALDLTANEPFTINPVNLSLGRSVSLSKKKLYRETFDTLKTIWAKDDTKSGYETYWSFNPPKEKKYINYYSPVIAGHDSIIAVKTSLSDPPYFVLINPSDKSEKRIHIPGHTYPWFISFARGKLVWVETKPDPRWENRSWSVIKLLDLKKNTTKQLSARSRYLSASISPDGNYIAASENTVENKNSLVIIDAWNGDVLKNIPSPGNAYLQRPQWDATGKKISVISLTKEGEGIMLFNTADNKWDTLIDAGNNDLQSSFLRNDSLFFVSSASGTDNIYLRKPDREIVPMTNSRFGATDPDLSGSLILFADYSSSGNNICYTTLPERQHKIIVRPALSSYLINRFKPVQTASQAYSGQPYKPVPYRKWLHLFRFHSWMPLYADIEQIKSDPTAIKPGLTLISQNNLSSLISTFGYEYSNKMHKFHSGIQWFGWYFVLESRLDYGNNPLIEKFRETVADPPVVGTGYSLTNTISLPLSFRSGRFSQSMYLSVSSSYQNNYIYVKEKGKYDSGQNQFTGRFYFSNYSNMAVRDIHPRWAQVIDLNYLFYPFDMDLYGDITTEKSALYTPGFMKNHGIKFRFEAERQSPVKYILSNRASFSRSYDNIISKEIQFLSADYYFPLVYPDFNVASLLYLTRIRADLFYDHTSGTGNYIFTSSDHGGSSVYHDYREIYRSFGIELMSDFYLLRAPFLISAGVQATWRDVAEAPYLKLLFNIDLFGMSIGKKKI